MSAGKLLHGQEHDRRLNAVVGYTQQEMDKGLADLQLGVANKEIQPTDRDSSLVKTFTVPTTALDAFTRVIATKVTVSELPDVLTSVTGFYNNSKGDGLYEASADGGSVGSSPSVTVSLDGNAQASISLTADLDARITVPRRYGNARVVSFLAQTPITEAAIRTRLGTILGATVNPWPSFTPQPFTFMVKSQESNLRVQVDVRQSVGLGSTNSFIQTAGTGYSRSRGSVTRAVTLPPTIHGALIVGLSGLNDTISATAVAGWTAGTNWPALSREITETDTVSAQVSPTSIPATPGASSIPISGLYLYRIDSQEFDWGYTFIVATVIDFSTF